MRRVLFPTVVGAGLLALLLAPLPILAAAPTCPAGDVAIGVIIAKNGNNCVSSSGNGVIVNYLANILTFLSAVVGAVILLMLIIAGVQYITSAGDPKAITNAKNRLVNAITALILFVMAFAILNFVVPGGIL
jgi:hypothetical protein